MFSMLFTATQDQDSLPSWIDKTKEKYTLEESNTMQKRKRVFQNIRTKMGTFQTRDQDFISKRETPLLKRLIRKNRINRLVKNFCIKMRHRITGSEVPCSIVEEESVERYPDHRLVKWINETEGWALSTLLLSLFSVLSIFSIVALMAVYSLTMAFEEISNDIVMQEVLGIVQLWALPVFVLELFLNFVTKRYEQGQALVYLNEIATKYMKGKFLMDFVNLVVLLVDILSDTSGTEMHLLRVVVFLKFPEVLTKVQVLENFYINTFYREQYWGLLMVLVTNFTFAHVLALLLNGMSKINPDLNWIKLKGLENATWVERYVWGYYWGTTIMLTVGFGDLVATNWQEALCLTFIQMISCISLAYNINCVGNLISNIRQQSRERTLNIKTFQQMAKYNSIERQLESKINNYIEESFLMKNQFNFKEQDTLLEYLPNNLRKEYLKDVNKRIFKSLPFIKDLTLSSQHLLAEKISRKISHPDEIILSKGDASKCIILRKGLLGLIAGSKVSCRRSCKVVQQLEVNHSESAKLLNLGFIRHRPLDFTLKSLTYSILYYFQNQDLQSYLRQNSIDYEDFCQQRDKFQTGISPGELYPCENCPKEYHSLFICPKLHFIPCQQLSISKFMHRLKFDKQETRVKINRFKVNMAFQILRDMDLIKDDIENFRHQLTDASSFDDELSMYEDSCWALAKSSVKDSLENNRESNQLSFEKHFEMKGSRLNSGTIDQKILMAMLETFRDKNFWQMEIDMLYNWKYYFPQDNPKNLKSKKLRYKRS